MTPTLTRRATPLLAAEGIAAIASTVGWLGINAASGSLTPTTGPNATLTFTIPSFSLMLLWAVKP